MDALPLGLAGDGALRAAVAADREVTVMEGARTDHLLTYLADAREAWVPPRVQLPGVEELVRLGGAGTPEVPEFAVCEVAAALGLSQQAGTALCADVLDLGYRLPRVAACVRNGSLPFSRARLIARRTRELSAEQAGLVEASVTAPRDSGQGPVPVATLVPMGRLRTMVDQAVLRARGPESEAEAAERIAQSLYVRLYRSEDGATDLAARLAAADAARLDARLDQIAGWLTQVGDNRSKPVLRAVALGLLADPAMLKALDGLRKDHAAPPPSVERHADVSDHTYNPDVRGGGGGLPVPLDLELLPQAFAPAPDGAGLSDLDPPPDDPPPDDPPPDDPPPDDPPPDDPPPDDADVLQDSRDLPPDDPYAPDVPTRPPGVAGLPDEVLGKLAGLVSTVLYVHLDAASGTWCEERAGALSKQQAEAIVGHSNVTVRPVLDLAANLTYTGYQAPALLREQLAMLNAGYCTFPGCSRRARPCDVDHREPWPRGFVDPTEATETGAGGRTESRNTHLLCRKHHRAKTSARWQVASPAPGIWVWRSAAGEYFLVTGATTTPLNGILTRARTGADITTEEYAHTHGFVDVG